MVLGRILSNPIGSVVDILKDTVVGTAAYAASCYLIYGTTYEQTPTHVATSPGAAVQGPIGKLIVKTSAPGTYIAPIVVNLQKTLEDTLVSTIM